jgi:hypothetical protein
MHYEATTANLNIKIKEGKEHLNRRRQAIVEHPYGIINRQWGFQLYTRRIVNILTENVRRSI